MFRFVLELFGKFSICVVELAKMIMRHPTVQSTVLERQHKLLKNMNFFSIIAQDSEMNVEQAQCRVCNTKWSKDGIYQ